MNKSKLKPVNRPKSKTLLSLLGLVSLTLGNASRASGPREPKAISSETINRSVIAAIAHYGVTKPRVISHIDLTGPFQTKTQWTFVAAQDDRRPKDEFEDHGRLYLCLVKSSIADCDQHFFQQSDATMNSLDQPYQLFTGKVVYGRASQSNPLLFLSACGNRGVNGNCLVASALYAYNSTTDRFDRVFLNFTGRNNNEATRFIERGLLQGDLIVDNPTENAPYTYWIEVYRAKDSGQYARILHYRSLTHYGDGNSLAVIDSEMPEILRRLGLWHTGDPLPVPPRLPTGCRLLSLRKGEEWCK